MSTSGRPMPTRQDGPGEVERLQAVSVSRGGVTRATAGSTRGGLCVGIGGAFAEVPAVGLGEAAVEL